MISLIPRPHFLPPPPDVQVLQDDVVVEAAVIGRRHAQVHPVDLDPLVPAETGKRDFEMERFIS